MILFACTKRWRVGTMDVKSALLQSDYIHQEVACRDDWTLGAPSHADGQAGLR